MKKILLFLGIFSLLYGCDGHEPAIPEKPAPAMLLFPYNNSLCNQGINATTTDCTIAFDWEESDHTDSYDLYIKDLTSGNIVLYQTTATGVSAILQRGKPYSWVVASKSETVAVTAQSETWKFYVAGEGAITYAPFPAEIVSPAMADTVITSQNVITLDWIGNDVDDDITGFDVYYGTTHTPVLIRSDLSESILTEVPISPNTIYFWKVITKDSHGNRSDSGVYMFKVQ